MLLSHDNDDGVVVVVVVVISCCCLMIMMMVLLLLWWWWWWWWLHDDEVVVVPCYLLRPHVVTAVVHVAVDVVSYRWWWLCSCVVSYCCDCPCWCCISSRPHSLPSLPQALDGFLDCSSVTETLTLWRPPHGLDPHPPVPKQGSSSTPTRSPHSGID